MLGGNFMEESNDKEILEIERKMRFVEQILNSFSKEQLVNYLTVKIVLSDDNFSDIPIYNKKIESDEN